MTKMTTIAVIGCSKTKKRGATKARNLYLGTLFTKRVLWLEQRNVPWYILSAKYGLLAPDSPVEGVYENRLHDLPEMERLEWHLRAAGDLVKALRENHGVANLKKVVLEVHAGVKYAEPLASILAGLGVTIDRHCPDITIGKQFAYYTDLLKTPPPTLF